MKRATLVYCILIIVATGVVTPFAKSHVLPCNIHAAPAEAPARMSVDQALDFWIGITEKEVVRAADAMPEEKYSFAPTAGEFTGARTFAEQVKHLAANNYRMAAYIMGERPPADQENETGPAAVQTKAQIMDYVRGSFAALHRAVATISTANMTEPLNLFPSPRQRTRLQLAEDVVAHSYDHYGQMVEYLRMNGIVPPASRR
jgi:uncharacterized damage-inducible protein DinB